MLRLKIINNPKPLRLRTQVNFPNVILGKMQEKTIIPKTTFQEVLPDKNYDGLSKVNVEAVTNEIDKNIKSENIKKDVSILGVQGNVEGLKGTKIEITKNGTYTPEEPYNAFTEVDVNVSADVSEYFGDKLIGGNPSFSALNQIIKKVPPLLVGRIDADRLFYWCTMLEVIPALDMSGVNTVREDFYRCYALTDFGGCINLGQMFSTTVAANYGNYKLALYDSTKLTHDSLMNVINNLYDIASKGCNTQQLLLGSTNMAKLTAEEIAIATNKGFSVS